MKSGMHYNGGEDSYEDIQKCLNCKFAKCIDCLAGERRLTDKTYKRLLRVQEMWDEGLSDSMMAAKLGCAESRIRESRRILGLDARKRRGKEAVQAV